MAKLIYNFLEDVDGWPVCLPALPSSLSALCECVLCSSGKDAPTHTHRPLIAAPYLACLACRHVAPCFNKTESPKPPPWAGRSFHPFRVWVRAWPNVEFHLPGQLSPFPLDGRCLFFLSYVEIISNTSRAPLCWFCSDAYRSARWQLVLLSCSRSLASVAKTRASTVSDKNACAPQLGCGDPFGRCLSFPTRLSRTVCLLNRLGAAAAQLPYHWCRFRKSGGSGNDAKSGFGRKRTGAQIAERPSPIALIW